MVLVQINDAPHFARQLLCHTGPDWLASLAVGAWGSLEPGGWRGCAAGRRSQAFGCCVAGRRQVCKPWGEAGVALCLVNHRCWEPSTPSRRWGLLGWSPNTCHHPTATAMHRAVPGRELEPAAGLCSHRPVWVLQSQGAISQVSPSPGTPWERQGGVGASLKARLGPVVWVQGEERACVIGSNCPCCQISDRRTERDPRTEPGEAPSWGRESRHRDP